MRKYSKIWPSLIICPKCGNEIESVVSACPYCGNSISLPTEKGDKKPYITVNLEHDQPLVSQALTKLETAIQNAKRRRVIVLKLIHGYGSHGVGGDIRYAVLQSLVGLRKHEIIADFIPGDEVIEQFEKLHIVKKKCPEIKNDPDAAHPNAGVTFVILRRN
ncbi:MAG: zinc-ribbon domain-containing protein [Candidatus Marinimicrobia bacterium]|nr:zinc-ribbon domain-containing protein [Candidatus Neomarinimicrobiota bacterium]